MDLCEAISCGPDSLSSTNHAKIFNLRDVRLRSNGQRNLVRQTSTEEWETSDLDDSANLRFHSGGRVEKVTAQQYHLSATMKCSKRDIAIARTLQLNCYLSEYKSSCYSTILRIAADFSLTTAINMPKKLFSKFDVGWLLLCSILVNFLLINTTAAYPLATSLNRDYSIRTNSIHSESHVHHVTNKEKNAIDHEHLARVLRSVSTPTTEEESNSKEQSANTDASGTSKEKGSPKKRDASSLMQHVGPQRLASKNGFYLQINKRGKVKGTRKQNALSMLEFISIRTGVVTILGKKSKLYLAMDKKGKLVGQKTYSASCEFYEDFVENKSFIFYHRTTVVVRKRRRINRDQFIALDRRGKPKRGRMINRNNIATHFQKMPVTKKIKKKKNRKGPKRKKKGRMAKRNRH